MALVPRHLRTGERPQHDVVDGHVAVVGGPPDAFKPYLKMDLTNFID